MSSVLRCFSENLVDCSILIILIEAAFRNLEECEMLFTDAV